MTVDKDRLEEELAALRAEVAEPSHGLFGPTSVVWHVNRESAIFLGAGRAALLQIAHPFVAHAVDEHSASRTDPWGRLIRTFDHVFTMVFADLDRAIGSARRVHAIHETVAGVIEQPIGQIRAHTRYDANTEDAIAWVAATLWDTSLLVFEAVAGPLSSAERDRYFREARKFTQLFGLPRAALPGDYASFRAYVDGMLASGSILAIDDVARRLAHDLMKPPNRWLAPLWHTYKGATASWLPPRLAEGFGLRSGLRERAARHAMVALARQARRAAPASVRFLPAYNEALARLAIAQEGPLVRELTRTWRKLVRGARRGPRSGAPAAAK